MLHTQAPQIDEIIENAINQAQERNEPQLISVVDQIEPSDPFQFLDAGTSINNHCLFWRSAEEDFTMVAVGSAYKMYAENENRFKEIQVMWDNIHQSASTYDEFNEKGTGIVALGGFSFDSNQNEQVPWEAFPDSQMTIPAFLLTNKGSESYLTTNVLIFPEDHKQQIITQLSTHRETLLKAGHQTFELPVRTDSEEIDPSGWKKSIEQATEDIKKGLLDKVVLARELRITFDDPVQLAAVIKALAETQPNSYIFAFESEGEYFVGATPERLAKLDKQQLVSTCLAGTIRRGKTKEEDVQLGEDLLYDPKNRQEHQFVVEMIRQAVEACCYNVQIPEAPVLYPLKNLQHLYTPVTAVLEKGYTLLDVIEKLHPTPALGGMPQKKSVDYIRTNEKLNRGWYAGPIGWFDMHNNGEFAVAIRSALIKSDKASLFAGCGVVEDSDPDAEYEETHVKLKPMLSVLGGC
ncbi:isochorismate synthase MenF [Halobacillus halophilus]|uniref:isochorismate synthase n=1 Tax=Halobacillus halophilus TaxID=1570 RepID=UPI001CD1CF29|nr:isochorismate synthase [Halobacillus halophilus]MCA1011044.1 isochorismate synthase [Halobacillus halophilus]